jgi:hypothetical protein
MRITDLHSFTIQRKSFTAVLLTLALISPLHISYADTSLYGRVVDAETSNPIAFVTVILNSGEVRVSDEEGNFDFGSVLHGKHILTFEHISYQRRVMRIRWPLETLPLEVTLAPSQFIADEIVVEGARPLPSLPVSSSSFTRRELTAAVGNIANDPLRTVQSQPSCASSGMDFLSKMAVRGGDSEEHRVYFDGYPLNHYAHVGGFSGLVYDDMLESTVLIPGTAPIQYKGSLSGIVLLKPARADTSFRSFRFDITSMAGGISQIVNPSLSFQLSAKTSFFNLPVYQEASVKERSFRDFLGRINYSWDKSLTMNTTLLMATDTERGYTLDGVKPERHVSSTLAGVQLAYRPSKWEVKLRPSYSLYDSRDAISWRRDRRSHRLTEARIHAEVSKQGSVAGLGMSGDLGAVRHSGNGGTLSDYPFSAAAELRLMYKDAASLVLGAGGSREPWTSSVEPEAYGSVWIYLGELAKISAGYRRSHQSPFLFSERRYFASVPIDAGDLLSSYDPTWESAEAVRMDQSSVNATINLPLACSIEFNGFHREYQRLLTWEWDAFPGFKNVNSEGDGHGIGYEFVFKRNDPEFLSVMAAVSRAKIYKKEGTLDGERIGDFDRPFSWQAGFSVELFDGVRFALRWIDVDGRPFTEYINTSDPPSDANINSSRLWDFQRLDVKLSYQLVSESIVAEGFIDVVNFLNGDNIVMMYALEITPGEFVSVPYGGTRFFPIVGVTIRW